LDKLEGRVNDNLDCSNYELFAKQVAQEAGHKEPDDCEDIIAAAFRMIYKCPSGVDIKDVDILQLAKPAVVKLDRREKGTTFFQYLSNGVLTADAAEILFKKFKYCRDTDRPKLPIPEDVWKVPEHACGSLSNYETPRKRAGNSSGGGRGSRGGGGSGSGSGDRKRIKKETPAGGRGSGGSGGGRSGGGGAGSGNSSGPGAARPRGGRKLVFDVYTERDFYALFLGLDYPNKRLPQDPVVTLRAVSASMVTFPHSTDMLLASDGKIAKPKPTIRKHHVKFCLSSLCLIGIRAIKKSRSWTPASTFKICDDVRLRDKLVDLLRMYVPYTEVAYRYENDDTVRRTDTTFAYNAIKHVDECDALGEWYQGTDAKMQDKKAFVYLTGDIGIKHVHVPPVEKGTSVVYDHYIMFSAIKASNDDEAPGSGARGGGEDNATVHDDDDLEEDF
jgi:hypothetical protein